MKNKIPYTSFCGVSEQLCAKGDAVEFIQPWYTPISTTPENTGIAVGGIGNTFTLTPKGNTPSFAFIPGIFIDNSDEQINFNEFYLSVAEELSLDQLDIRDLDEMKSFLGFYPAIFSGQELNVESKESALEIIRAALSSGLFYQQNADNFSRWKVEFSDLTQKALAQDVYSLKAQLLVAVDFFDGLLVNRSARLLSLTAGTGSEKLPAISGEDIHFSALYPIAEFDYSEMADVSVSRKVVSPIVKDDKKLCSLPAHWNEFELTNNSSKTKVVTLVQSLKNLNGSTYSKQRPGVQDSACILVQNPVKQQHFAYGFETKNRSFSGVIQGSESGYRSDIEGKVLFGADVDCSLIDAGKVGVSVKPTLYSTKEEQTVLGALNTGRVNQWFDKGIYSGREALSSVVSIQVELAANESVSVRFVQIMDHCKVALQDWVSEKAYSQFYPQSCRVSAILSDLLQDIDDIEAKIVAEQQRYLDLATQAIDNEKSAVQYATMAMNSLSFLAEATVWDCRDRFLVKECVDYPFFNSLDVYFYGSFSLLYLLPELDGCVMREFSDAILAEDLTKRRFWEYEDKPYAELIDRKYEGVRGRRGAVIHDLGSPWDIRPDAYTWHNVKEWKDLAPKYILMVYRHYKFTGDLSVVSSCWQAVKESIEFLTKLIAEGDVIPLTCGTDDTFDNLSSHGISIYCGSLWAAGLYAAAELAKLMDETSIAQELTERGKASLDLLERTLWDEDKGYFHFYVTPIQARHLTGKDYQELETLGLELTGDRIKDKEILNRYLDAACQGCAGNRIQTRYQAKRTLVDLAPYAFTEQYRDIIENDSDNSFGDAMLADSYLKLLGMEGLFDIGRIERALDYIYRVNFKQNSPKLGVANMTLANGMPHEAFQAQDVWIGVQFSVATALRLAGKNNQAVELMDTVYGALYAQAKIPFAAPEGFNCSVAVSIEDIMEQFSVSEKTAQAWYDWLKETRLLLADGRVNPEFETDFEAFNRLTGTVVEAEYQQSLHIWLKNTGLKYTAGRYFRPGMIFAYLTEALR